MTTFAQTDQSIRSHWDSDTLQALEKFISIPCLSLDFDADWEKHGLLLQALEDAKQYAKHLFPDGHFDIMTASGRAPCLFFEIPASQGHQGDSVLFYGHLDKQPAGSGWSAPREPFRAHLEGEKLYGRGGADDGYSVYAALSVLHAMRKAGLSHPKAYGLFETAEESGSPGLAEWIDVLRGRMQKVGLVAVLDSGAGDYARLWDTVSFRGVLSMTLRVSVLSHGVHSGLAAGLVPDSFMLARALLSRIEDATDGRILLPELWTEIPAQRIRELQNTARILGGNPGEGFPLLPGLRTMVDDSTDALVARSWKPQLTVTGAEGLPSLALASNALRPETALRLSIRIPPHIDLEKAKKSILHALTDDVPYSAKAAITDFGVAPGWNSPTKSTWLSEAMEHASQELFGESVGMLCEGGSIGILDDFERAFPQAQFLVTGVLGPKANAHGPDECLHLDYLKKFSCALARILNAVP